MTLRERGAAALLLLSLSAVSCSPPAVTASSSPSPFPPGRLASDAATLFGSIAAYDHALAGGFAGEPSRTLTPDRYVEALKDAPGALLTLKDRLMRAAFADPTLAAPLVDLADAVVVVHGDLDRFADARDADAFAPIVGDLPAGWTALRGLAAKLPPDPDLASAIASGTAWTVTVGRAGAFAVVTPAYASRQEALAAAKDLGTVERVADAAPFTIRIATYGAREPADQRVAALADDGVVAAVAPVDRYTFARGPFPTTGSLWREAVLDVTTRGASHRAAFAGDGFVVANDDGTTFLFDAQGRPKWGGRVPTGTSFVAPAPGGKVVAVGGQSVSLLSLADGSLVAPAVRLPSVVTAALWRDGAFVAASQGPTGRAEGGGGAVVAMGADGIVVEPFPLVTPAAGPALAASPAHDDVLIATTTRGTTDVEAIRPGRDRATRVVARAGGQVVDLVADADGGYAVLVTNQGTFRFRPWAGDGAVERVGAAARDAAFGADGTLYLVFDDRVAAFDRDMRQQWSLPLADGRRLAVARRVIVQDGLGRVVAVDRATGTGDDLAVGGDVTDLAVSADGARVLLLVDARHALVFALP